MHFLLIPDPQKCDLTYFLGQKKCVILHFLVGPGAPRMCRTLRNPIGILEVLRNHGFPGNPQFRPRVRAVFTILRYCTEPFVFLAQIANP